MKTVGLYSLISPSVKMTSEFTTTEIDRSSFWGFCEELPLLSCMENKPLAVVGVQQPRAARREAFPWGCGVGWVLRGREVGRKLPQTALYGTREEKYPVSCHFLSGRAAGYFKQLVRGSKWT